MFWKKKKYSASEFLPTRHRTVIVDRGIKSIPPFQAMLTARNNELCWLGLCGTKKDRYLRIFPTDKWFYE